MHLAELEPTLSFLFPAQIPIMLTHAFIYLRTHTNTISVYVRERNARTKKTSYKIYTQMSMSEISALIFSALSFQGGKIEFPRVLFPELMSLKHQHSTFQLPEKFSV